jgi:hypothetical protein
MDGCGGRPGWSIGLRLGGTRAVDALQGRLPAPLPGLSGIGGICVPGAEAPGSMPGPLRGEGMWGRRSRKAAGGSAARSGKAAAVWVDLAAVPGLGREATVEASRSGTSGSPDLEVGPRTGTGDSPHLKVGLRTGAGGSPHLKARSPAGASGLRTGTSLPRTGASGLPHPKVGPPAGTGRPPGGASGSPELKVDSPAGTSRSPASKGLP